MPIRDALRSFLPPALLHLRRRFAFDCRTFQSYAAAATYCPASGEDTIATAAIVVEKTRALRAELAAGMIKLDCETLRAALAISLAAGDRDELHVIDFGGAAGAHYFTLQRLFPSLRLRWCVVETPAMVGHAGIFESATLRLVETIAAARALFPRCDLVFSSGALQYTPEPLRYLEQLLAMGAPCLYLARLAVVEQQSRVMLQHNSILANGPGVAAGGRDRRVCNPVTFLRRAHIEEEISARYRIEHEFAGATHIRRAGAEWVTMVGYFGRLK